MNRIHESNFNLENTSQILKNSSPNNKSTIRKNNLSTFSAKDDLKGISRIEPTV